jgi:hypothetical protein
MIKVARVGTPALNHKSQSHQIKILWPKLCGTLSFVCNKNPTSVSAQIFQLLIIFI